jgi:hypothetical protein
VLYRFDGIAGETVSIRMTRQSGDLDPYLKLLDEAGTVLAENDDDPDLGRDSAINGFVLPDDGVYLIMATRFQEELGTLVGDFALTLTLGEDMPTLETTPTAAPTEAGDDSGGLVYGGTLSGTINEDSSSLEFPFTGSAGDVITLRMNATSGTLDSYLILLDPAGEVLTENDDDPSGVRDSLIEAFELPEDGIYTVIATRYQRELGGTEGTFDLSLELISGDSTESTDTQPTPFALVQPEVEAAVSLDDLVEGELTPEKPIAYYSFEGTANQSINIFTSRLDVTLDILMMLLAPDGRVIALNDDANRFDNKPYLDNVVLPVDGQYTIVVTRSPDRPGTQGGEFEFFVNAGTGDPSLATIYPVEVVFGETYTAELMRFGKEAVYVFAGQEGDTIQFEIRPLAPVLGRGTRVATFHLLINPAAGVVVSRGNTTTGQVTLPATGYYVLIVDSRRGDGAVEVVIDQP